MKKLVSVLLATVLLLTCIPLTAVSVSADYRCGDYYYTLVDVLGETTNEATITDYVGSATDLVIPTKLDGYYVKTIGSSAFKNCTSLTSVTIPSGVSIYTSAFYGCSQLNSVYISAGIMTISADAFEYCSTLTAFYVDKNNYSYSSIDGVLYNKNATKLVLYPIYKAYKKQFRALVNVRKTPLRS